VGQALEQTAVEIYQQQNGWSPERRLLHRVVAEEGTSVADVARAIGKHRSAVSQYLHGKYSSARTLEPLIRDYLKSTGYWQEGNSAIAMDGTVDDETAPAPDTDKLPAEGWMRSIRELGLVPTRDLERIWGVCKKCHDSVEMGVITGDPGAGKSFALEEYEKRAAVPMVCITCDTTSTKRSILADTAEALGLKDYGSSAMLLKRIVKSLKQQPRLLVYDEADLMKNDVVLETVRAIYDKARVGVVLVGNEVLAEKILLYAEDRPEMARLRDRIGYYVRLSGLSNEEAHVFLARINATPAARRLLCDTGAKRGIRQLVKALGRLLDVTGGAQITEDLVEELGQIVLSFKA
jgi:DNA transposition AAA+ family ATPase